MELLERALISQRWSPVIRKRARLMRDRARELERKIIRCARNAERRPSNDVFTD